MLAKIRVMLVDDSAVVRGMVDRALLADGEFEVVASAGNGEVAINMLKKVQVDVIILDIEMPVMDGIQALPKILETAPKTRVIMSSTLTQSNAEISMRAMELGAADYIAKPSSRDVNEVTNYYAELIRKVKALAPRRMQTTELREPVEARPVSQPVVARTASPTVPAHLRKVDQMLSIEALAIASSTGGPQALLTIFSALNGIKPRVPIFLTQHMPANFTAILADHIRKSSGLDCHEAKDGETVQAGVIYVAPGDYHMTVERTGTNSPVLRLDQSPPENFCRPSADPMLRSLSKLYNDRLLVVVLTGLGADGAKGASDVVAHGGVVVTQDEASCVVYGMPKAVVEAQLSSAVIPLAEMANFFKRAVT